MEWIPPPKPRRDEDALREAVGAEPHGARLLRPRRRTPGPSRRAERLHRARNTCHRARRISPSRKRGSSGLTPFAQQSRCTTAEFLVDILFRAEVDAGEVARAGSAVRMYRIGAQPSLKSFTRINASEMP